MTKRQAKTTGIPKDKPKPIEAAPQKSRHQREAEVQRYVLLGTGVTVAIIGVILLAAIVLELIITPNQTVATVNGQSISVAQFESRVRLERALLNDQINGYLNQLRAFGMDPNQFASQEPLRTWLSKAQIPDQMGNAVIEDMVSDTLVRQKAAEMGITVTDEEIQKQIDTFFGFNRETIGVEPTPTLTPTITPTPFVSPTPSPAPTATPEATAEATGEATAEATADVTVTPTPFPTIEPTPTFTVDQQVNDFNTRRDDYFNNIKRLARVGDGDLRTFFETRALREKLRDAVLTDLTTDAPHVNARHILVATQEEAEDILAALNDGESFADLARASSTDTGSGAQGGELGWSSVYGFVKPFGDAVMEAPIGEIIGPIETEFGWHIIQVRARENREVTEDELNQAKDSRFTTWLEDLRNSEETKVDISSIWTDHVPTDPAFIAS